MMGLLWVLYGLFSYLVLLTLQSNDCQDSACRTKNEARSSSCGRSYAQGGEFPLRGDWDWGSAQLLVL